MSKQLSERMVGQRRFERFLGVIFLTAGAVLLSTTAVAWFSAYETPAVIGRAPREHSLKNLPPALAPFVQSSTQSEETTERAKEGEIEAPDTAAAGSEILLPSSALDAGEGSAVEPPIEAAASISAAQPQRLLIPALDIDAEVQPAGLESFESSRRSYFQWTAPDAYAAGWHNSSALPGRGGNTVLSGHNNVHGAIFADLAHLPVGEQIVLESESGAVVYRVAHHELVKEQGVSLRERLRNARWIAPTDDERLTLVTCWPNTGNSHRLIVVAKPVSDAGG